MKRKRAKSRVPVGTAVREEIYVRIMKQRERGYSVPDIIIEGLKVCEVQSPKEI